MRKITLILLICLILSGCINSSPYPTLELPDPESPTPKVFPTLDPQYLSPVNSATAESSPEDSTPIPSLTYAPKVSDTPTPNASPTAIPLPSCNYDDLINQARVKLGEIEHILLINRTNEEQNLYLWYVTSVESGGDLTEYRENVLEELTLNLNAFTTTNPDCTAKDFSHFRAVIVNENLDIILSGKINPQFIPAREIKPEDDLSLITPYFELSFLIEELPEADNQPADGCTLQEIRTNLQISFGIDNQNQGIYFFQNPDHSGTIVAQWHGSNEVADISGKLVNLIFETSCFYKQVDQIVVNVIDDNNTVIYIGLIEGNNGAFLLTDLQTIYIAP